MSVTLAVANAAELRTAIRGLKGGESILLAPGDYGRIAFSSVNPASLVTIRSADPGNDALFSSLNFVRSSNIALVDVDVSRPIQPGERAGTFSAVAVTSSRDIRLAGIDLTGSLDNNASNDGQGMTITGSQRITIVDSTFRQFKAAAVISLNQDIIFAGNSISEVREGVNISGLTDGLFERNLIRDLQPDYAAGDHPDAFQVHSSRGGGSSQLLFQDNVILEGKSGPIGGIFLGNETYEQGSRHSDIAIVNNFYQGTFRHGISVSGAVDVLIDGNTVLNSNKAGNSAAIMLTRVQGATVSDNVAPLFLNTSSTGVTSTNNINVLNNKFKAGIAASSLFESDVAAGVASATSNFNPLAGSLAALRGVGYRMDGPVGDLGSDLAAAGFAESYARMYSPDGFTHALL